MRPKAFAVKTARVMLSVVQQNTFGDAVRTGIAEAMGERIIFMDADGSHAPEFILKLIDQSDANEIVIASRYVEGGVNGKR